LAAAVMNQGKPACKPGSVEDDHSSGPRVTTRPQATNPEAARATPWLPYLVLLRTGFTLPLPLPAARCALTAPFHPCRQPRLLGRSVFCGTFR